VKSFILWTMSGVWNPIVTLVVLCVLTVAMYRVGLRVAFFLFMRSQDRRLPLRQWWLGSGLLGRAWQAKRNHYLVGVVAIVVAGWGLALSACSSVADGVEFQRSGSLVTLLALITAFIAVSHAKGLSEFREVFKSSVKEAPRATGETKPEARGESKLPDDLARYWATFLILLGTLIIGYGDVAFVAVSTWACSDEVYIQLSCSPERKKFAVFFPLNEARPKPESKMVPLDAVMFARINPKAQFQVSAHADNSGSIAQNMDLSARRVNFVRRVLLDMGVPEKQISTTFFSATRPMALPRDDEKNRRAEIEVIVHGGGIEK
jgi:outer membrane protein OmpA-like peptidoglycan-associated protein